MRQCELAPEEQEVECKLRLYRTFFFFLFQIRCQLDGIISHHSERVQMREVEALVECSTGSLRYERRYGHRHLCYTECVYIRFQTL